MDYDQIVADGAERLVNDPEMQKRIAEAREAFVEKYRKQWERAGFFKRLWLRWKIRSEMVKKMKDLAPPDALYLNVKTKQPTTDH